MAKRRPFDETLFRRLWAEGNSIMEIALACGRSYKTCQDLRAKLGLPKRNSEYRSRIGGIKHADPTPEEIKIACELIRSRWSPEEKERRRSGHLREDE
jgi:hypothetical protein